MLVISPFSRGGHIASEMFDHTSQLQLVAERFGVEVPNVSAWRRETVGDLTSTMFQIGAEHEVPDAAAPPLSTCRSAAPARPSRPGHRIRWRLAQRADEADDARSGRRLAGGVPVFRDDAGTGRDPRGPSHLAELPLTGPADREITLEPARRRAPSLTGQAHGLGRHPRTFVHRV